MPIQSCQKDNKPGFRWGRTGKCYTYVRGNEQSRKTAITKAQAQGRAIKARSNDE